MQERDCFPETNLLLPLTAAAAAAVFQLKQPGRPEACDLRGT